MSEDEEFVRHLESLGVPVAPEDRSRRVSSSTEEGALLAFSGSLRRSNPKHRFVAWLLLVALGTPALLTLLWLAGQALHWIWAQAS